MERENLLMKIEKLRQEMYIIMNKRKKFTDQKLIKKSNKMDKLLNQYVKYIEDRHNL